MVSKRKRKGEKMLTYQEIKKDESRFLALTSISVTEFDDLLQTFKGVWEADVEKRAYAKPRQRKVGGGRKTTLKSIRQNRK